MIDAHVHLWSLGAHGCTWPTAADGVLFRDFTRDELCRTLDAAAIDRALLVQSQEDARDTAWLLDLARSERRIAGVIGWTDLRAPAALADLAAAPLLKGVRPMVQDRADDWFDQPALADGFAAMGKHGLVLDALVRPRHLPALERLARRWPALAIVIDHAAKPQGAAGLAAWRAALAPLACCPNASVKLSGLLTELPPEAVPAAVAAVLELFGAERLIWGSDWPVVTARAGYDEWLATARALVPAAAHAAVFGGNAARVYQLDAADA